MAGWERYAAEGGRILWGLAPAPNPTVGGVLVDDLGLVNDTPQVTIDVGGETRRATYLPPHAIRAGRPVFAERLGPDLSAPWVVVATNYQCDPFVA